MTTLVDQLSIDLKTAVDKISTVSDGKLDEVASALIGQKATMETYKADQAKDVDNIHEILTKIFATCTAALLRSSQ